MDFFRYYNLNRVDIELCISLFTAEDVRKVDELRKFLQCLQRQYIEIWPLQSLREYEDVLKTYELLKNNKKYQPKSSVKLRDKIKQLSDEYKQKQQERRLKMYYFGCKDEILEFIASSEGNIGVLTDSIDALMGYNYDDKRLLKVLEGSKLLVFCLTKYFINSKQFEKQLKEMKAKKREMLFVLLDDVNMTNFKIDKNKIFKLFKHENDRYFGYETKKFFNEMSKVFMKNLPLQYKKKKQVYLAHGLEYLKEITELKQTFFKANIHVSSKIDAEIEECLDEIEKSAVAVFLITNSYLNSEIFEVQIKSCNDLNKVVLLVLMENIEKRFKINDDFKVIDISRKRSNIRYLYGFVLRVFGRDGHLSFNNDTLVIKPIVWNKSYFNSETRNPIQYVQSSGPASYLEEEKSNYGEMLKVNFIEIKSKNQFVIVSKGRFRFYNHETCEFEREMSIELLSTSNIHVVCWIEHLCLFCTYHATNILLIDELGAIKRRFSLNIVNPIVTTTGYISIEYSKSNKRTYLVIDNKNSVLIFDRDFNFEKAVKLKGDNGYQAFIKIYQERVYSFSYESQCIHVYDLELGYITAFGFSILNSPEFIFIDSNNSNYLLVYDTFTIYVFQISTFKCVGSLQQSTYYDMRSGGCFWNSKFLIDSIFGVRVYDVIKYNLFDNRLVRNEGLHLKIDSKFICKLNPSSKHLYRNAYVLPCGNLACLDCIYDNFNIFTNTFKCNFETCKMEHGLMRSDLRRSEDRISQDLEEVYCKLLDYEKEYFDETRLFDRLETRINNIEVELECRIESLKIEFDKLNEILIEKIDEFERALLERNPKVVKPIENVDINKYFKNIDRNASLPKDITEALVGNLVFKNEKNSPVIRGWISSPYF